MEFCHIYREMLEALQQGGLYRVADAAYRIMDMPVMIADTSYVVAAICPETETGDQQWDSSRMGEPILVEAIIAYQYDGHWNAIREAQGAVCIDWGYCKEHPKYVALVEKEGKVLGSMAFLIGAHPREEWLLQAVRIIALAVGITNLVNIFQPEVICIGGGVSQAGPALLKPLREIVAAGDYARDSSARGDTPGHGGPCLRSQKQGWHHGVFML